MEQKDPDFNIHDYVDLSRINDPEKYRAIEATLQGFADSALVDGQTLLKDSAVIQGQKIIITADDSTPSKIINGNIVNLNFEQIATGRYYTSHILGEMNLNNIDEILARRDSFTTEASSLSSVLWHELEHIRNPYNNDAKKQFDADIVEFRKHFDNYIENADLTQATKDRWQNYGTSHEESSKLYNDFSQVVSNADNERQQKVMKAFGITYDKLSEEGKPLHSLNVMAVIIKQRYREQTEIDATNENFRKPMGLDFRFTHAGITADSPEKIETFTEMKQRLFEENLPDLELYYKGEKVTEDFTVDDVTPQTDLPATPQSTPSKERE